MKLFLFASRMQEGPGSFLPTPGDSWVEETVINAVQWLRLGVEAVGAMFIAIGVLAAAYYFSRALIRGEPSKYNEVRLILGRYLALALEFQLGADILSTAVAPSWDQIGKLGAIAVIRTGLNFFLMREIQEERAGVDAGDALEPDEEPQHERGPGEDRT